MGVTTGTFRQALRLAHAAGWDEANRRVAREQRAVWTAEDWDHAAATMQRVLAALGFDEQGSPRGGETVTQDGSSRYTH